MDDAKSRAVEGMTEYAIMQMVVWTGPLSGFMKTFVDIVLRRGIRWLATQFIDWTDGQLFSLNMKILTSDQAKDYRAKLALVLNSPDDIPDEEWERLEREANDAFNQLVSLSK